MDVEESGARTPWAGVGVGTAPPVVAPTVAEELRPPPVDRPEPRFSRFGRSPLPLMAASAVAALVAWAAFRWMEAGDATGDGAPPFRLVRSFWTVLAQGEDIVPSPHGNRSWVALAVATAAVVVALAWIRRVGQNSRREPDQFGALLALVALPEWFWLPLALPDAGADRSDTLLRYVFTLLFMLAQVGVARSVFANRLWKAGRLPFEWGAALLWVPALAAYGWLLGAWCFTLVEIGDDGRGHSAWRPTELHADLATWAGRLSYVGTLVVLVVASVRQHVGLQHDRDDDAAFHDELAAEQRRLHAGVPGV
ncbi:MAG: hypothetical protein KF703_15070 [Actinobacteria bacterium]|nr:hypothetical protein [Actinomycetota bacterium]